MKIAKMAMILFTVFMLGSGCRTTNTRATEYTSGTTWELTNVDLDISVLPENEEMLVEGTALLRLEGPASDGLILVLADDFRVITINPPEEAEYTISNTEVEGVGNLILISVHFPKPREAGTEVEVGIRYAWAQNPSSHFLVVQRRIAFASSDYLWYPISASLTDRTYDMDATGITRLRVPKEWRTLSNGRLTESSITGDMREETWVTSQEVERSFIAGPYHTTTIPVGEKEVGVYLLKEDSVVDDPQNYAQGLAHILDNLASRFGPYPFESYSVAEVPDEVMIGGQAEHGYIMVNSMFMRGINSPNGVNIPLIGHELGHSWWGNHVKIKGPASAMVNEGLAQYGAVLALETIEGPEASTHFMRFSRPLPEYDPSQSAKGYFELWRDGRDRTLMTLGPQDVGIGKKLAKSKGMWIYHMLRQRIGEELFFNTLQEIVKRHVREAISMVDIRDAFLSAAPPEADLETFFEQWLERTGAPVLEVEWNDVENNHGQGKVVIRQEGKPYQLNLEVALESKEGSKLHSIVLSEGEKSFLLETNSKITDVILDPNHKLLIWHPDYGPKP